MARPTTEEMEKLNYLKEQCRQIEQYLNQLEIICSSSVADQKEELIGQIGLYVGKIGIRFLNVEERIGVLGRNND